MADLRMRMELNVKLNEAEFRLVCLGLSGALRSEEDSEASMELNQRLRMVHVCALRAAKQDAEHALLSAAQQVAVTEGT